MAPFAVGMYFPFEETLYTRSHYKNIRPYPLRPYAGVSGTEKQVENLMIPNMHPLPGWSSTWGTSVNQVTQIGALKQAAVRIVDLWYYALAHEGHLPPDYRNAKERGGMGRKSIAGVDDFPPLIIARH